MAKAMSRRLLFLFLAWLSSSAYAGSPSLTVYAAPRSSRTSYGESNAGFAVVRDTIPLALQQGDNEVLAPPVSPMLDPASVILRDPTGKSDFRILLQKFRADPLTQETMLARFEGQTIPFQIRQESLDRFQYPPRMIFPITSRTLSSRSSKHRTP
jgi:hypothetical protein